MTSGACRRRSAAPAGTCRAAWFPPTTRRRWPRRSVSGSATPTCATGGAARRCPAPSALPGVAGDGGQGRRGAGGGGDMSATWRLLGHPVAGALLGLAVLLGLVGGLGTGPVLHGLGSIGAWPLAAAVLIGVPVTVCCALRWSLVCRGLGVPRRSFCPGRGGRVLPGAVPEHRAAGRGPRGRGPGGPARRAAGSPGRAAGAVALERLAGQVVEVAPPGGAAGGAVAGAGGPPVGGRVRWSPPRSVACWRSQSRGSAAAASDRASTPYAGRCWTGGAGRASCSPRWGRWWAASSPSWSLPARSVSPRRPCGCCRSPSSCWWRWRCRPTWQGGGRARVPLPGRSGRPGSGADLGLATAVAYGVLVFVAALPGGGAGRDPPAPHGPALATEGAGRG